MGNTDDSEFDINSIDLSQYDLASDIEIDTGEFMVTSTLIPGDQGPWSIQFNSGKPGEAIDFSFDELVKLKALIEIINEVEDFDSLKQGILLYQAQKKLERRGDT